MGTVATREPRRRHQGESIGGEETAEGFTQRGLSDPEWFRGLEDLLKISRQMHQVGGQRISRGGL
jgi:hypothetical protein